MMRAWTAAGLAALALTACTPRPAPEQGPEGGADAAAIVGEWIMIDGGATETAAVFRSEATGDFAIVCALAPASLRVETDAPGLAAAPLVGPATLTIGAAEITGEGHRITIEGGVVLAQMILPDLIEGLAALRAAGESGLTFTFGPVTASTAPPPEEASLAVFADRCEALVDPPGP